MFLINQLWVPEYTKLSFISIYYLLRQDSRVISWTCFDIEHSKLFEWWRH